MPDVYLTIRPAEQNLSHLWRTIFQKTVKGKEKRTALFTWTRVILKNTIRLTSNKNINWFKRNLMNYVDEIWYIPIWADKTTVSSSAASGQKIIAVAQTTYRHFYAGRKVIIINPADSTSYETGIIDTLTAIQITLTENLSATWAAGSLILPLYGFRLDPNQNILADLKNYQNIEFTSTEAFETVRTFTYTLPASGADTYQSIDLFLQPFNGPIKYGYNRPYQKLQFIGICNAYSDYDAGENSMGINGSLMRSSRQEIWDTLNFFDSKMGRLSRFWVPTWSKDIVATLAILATATVIDTENIEYTTYFLPNDVIGKYIYIQFPDKTYVCREITGSTAISITIDSQIGTAVSTSGLDKLTISFLNLSRFDIDQIDIDYQSKQPDIAKTDLSFMGIVEETV